MEFFLYIINKKVAILHRIATTIINHLLFWIFLVRKV
ncbi:purinergic receptor P2X, ligand-gated ion channel, 5, partial [Listeria innocua FSL S4-378]